MLKHDKEAIDKGTFPDHIARDGTAYYSDGSVLPPNNQQSVGERCVKCYHGRGVRQSGLCAAITDSGYYFCSCACVFPSVPEAQLAGERIVNALEINIGAGCSCGVNSPDYICSAHQDIDTAISKAKADTWKEAIETANSVDLYHRRTTNPEHDSLKSAQEVKAEIVRMLEVGAREKLNE